MRSFAKLLIFCALCAAIGGFWQTSAQNTTSTKRRSPADAAARELNRLLVEAQDAVSKEDYASAARCYQDYLAKKPDDASVHYNLGYAYMELDRPNDAKAEYEKAVELDPKMEPAYENLGMTLLPSDPAAAVEPLQHAANLQPEDAHAKWLLALALEKSGQLPQAIEQYNAAERLDGKDVNIRTSLASALLKAKRFPEAEATYRAALALHPEGTPLQEVHLGLADALVAQKKLSEAAAEFGAYLALAPNDNAVRLERASALVDLGKDDDALAELDRAASGGPEGLRALKLRSQIDWETKRYDDAVPVLEKAVALAPRDADLADRLGRVYLQKKDYPNAVHWLVIAYNLSPTANDLLAQVIEAEYLNKNYAETLQALDTLSKREQLPLASWYLRATCYDKLGQLQEALDAYQKFLQLNTDENSDMYFVSTSRVRTLTRELKEKKR